MNRKNNETYVIKISNSSFDIIHIDSTKVTGNINKVNVSGGKNKNCYVIKFPEASSQEERMMMIIGILHCDSNWFLISLVWCFYVILFVSIILVCYPVDVIIIN